MEERLPHDVLQWLFPAVPSRVWPAAGEREGRGSEMSSLPHSDGRFLINAVEGGAQKVSWLVVRIH